MKDKIKNGVIVGLFVIIGFIVFFGSRKVEKYKDEVTALKADNEHLSKDILRRTIEAMELQIKVDARDKVVDSLKKAFQAKDAIIAGLDKDLKDALAKLTGITSDESYQFLQNIAYPFPGTLQYMFNAPQVKGIHGDYLVARNAEKVIPEMNLQILNAKEQFVVRDSIEHGLKLIIKLQKDNLKDCEAINQNNQTIIKDVEKQRDKEARRKQFWRSVSAVTSTVAVLFKFGIL